MKYLEWLIYDEILLHQGNVKFLIGPGSRTFLRLSVWLTTTGYILRLCWWATAVNFVWISRDYGPTGYPEDTSQVFIYLRLYILEAIYYNLLSQVIWPPIWSLIWSIIWPCGTERHISKKLKTILETSSGFQILPDQRHFRHTYVGYAGCVIDCVIGLCHRLCNRLCSRLCHGLFLWLGSWLCYLNHVYCTEITCVAIRPLRGLFRDRNNISDDFMFHKKASFAVFTSS